MARFFRGVPGCSIAYFGLSTPNYDKINTPGYEDLEKKKPTGWAGVRRIFSLDEYGEPTPEFVTLGHMSSTAVLVGALGGAVKHGRQAWIDFMTNNQASLFANHFEAQRKLQDTVLLAMGKGGFKWGWKIGAFNTVFLVSNAVIAAYNGKPGFIEFLISGAITGCLWKMNLGMKGSIAGTVVGSLLGALAGAATMMMFYITGLSFEDVYESQYAMKQLRDEAKKNVVEKVQSEDCNKLVQSAMRNKTLPHNLDQIEEISDPVSNTK